MPLIKPRPSFTIEGSVRADLSGDLLSMTYDERLHRLEITFNNMESGTLKYADDSSLFPKTRVAVNIEADGARTLLFDGTIYSFAPNFPSDTAPTLTLVATEKRGTLIQNDFAVTFGSELQEFYPVLKGNRIRSTGLLEGNPNIRRGTSLTVSGVGRFFSHPYIVASTIHRFDSTGGYQTRFISVARVTLSEQLRNDRNV